MPADVDETEKVGASTLSCRGVVVTAEPDVPVMVRLYTPTSAELPAVIVMVLDLVVGFGEKDAVTPAGRPAIEKDTLPVNPRSGCTSSGMAVDDPWMTLPAPPPPIVKKGACTLKVLSCVTV
jgi:hypothetical protein